MKNKSLDSQNLSTLCLETKHLRGFGGGGSLSLALLLLEVESVDGGDNDGGKTGDVLPVEFLREEHEGDDDGEHLTERLHDLGLSGTEVLDEGKDERNGRVAHDGEAHDHRNNLRVRLGEGESGVEATGRDERNQTVGGTDQGRVAEDFLGRGRSLDAEEVLLLEVGADGVDTQGTSNEKDTNRGEGRGGRNVTEGEEDDTRDEDGGGQPLLPVVLLTDNQDGESHDRNNLGRLEHDTGRVVEVGQRVVGQSHTTVGVDGENTVVLPGRLARVVGELHFERTAQEVGEGGQDGHPRGASVGNETRDAENTFLERGEAEGRAEGTGSQNDKGQAFVFRQVEAEHLLRLARGSLGDTTSLAVNAKNKQTVSTIVPPRVLTFKPRDHDPDQPPQRVLSS